ncbi:MAG TPA: 30S ribosomal protein S12 methylthiotransferase RimO [Chitinophagales bacterium]|nr:30S ribosomal protein S12 methylthiotransferase RimO [Chitinophagales bacterium]
MKTKAIKKDKVSVITLGCSKNTVDSEVLMGQLQHGGYDVQHDKWSKGRNIVIVNTCGFIDKAKEESINTIMEYADAKSEGKIEKLYVTGCLSQRYKDNLETEIPEVDAFFGTMELPRLLKTLKVDYKHELIGERFLTTPIHYAYMKISEGCNRTCSFCAIPLMRGKHVSRPIEELVSEAKKLAAQGVKELMLIAQELTFYGLDIYKKRRLPELLNELSKVEGIAWIRLHYAYPAQFPMEIIDAIAENPKVCNYLDMPLQHAADNILTGMRRNITNAETRELIHKIRERIPDIAIRTTMLVGYPGETEQDFEELKSFIQDMRFERLGVFTYSHEENTRAHKSDDDIPQEVKEYRAAELMGLQETISYELNQQKVGKTYKVLFDRKEGGYFIGRTEFDSPEVDNEVLVPATNNYISKGSFANVKITSAEEFDLYGELV